MSEASPVPPGGVKRRLFGVRRRLYLALGGALAITLAACANAWIAFLETESLQREEVHLLKGDLLLLFTDGLIEAAHPRRGQFGIERLQEVVRTVDLSMSVDEIRDYILGKVRSYLEGGALADDLTLVCVHHGD